MKLPGKYAVIALLSFMLSGCITAAVVGGTAAGAAASAVVYDKRPVKTIANDEKLAHAIQEGLSANPTLRQNTNLSVAVYRGWVLLVGQAATAADQQEALDIIKTVPGIINLFDEITIQPPIDRIARTNDTWLTTKIKTKLLTEKGLKSGQFKIVTENNVVYLMGLATPAQTQLAVGIIRNTGGVQKVVKVMRYLSGK
jgi:osmotically-inducible protein OsmY